jgi:hypothetical protein
MMMMMMMIHFNLFIFNLSFYIFVLRDNNDMILVDFNNKKRKGEREKRKVKHKVIKNEIDNQRDFCCSENNL